MNARMPNQATNALTNFIVTIAAGIKRTTLPWLQILFLGAVLVRTGFQVSQWIIPYPVKNWMFFVWPEHRSLAAIVQAGRPRSSPKKIQFAAWRGIVQPR